MAAVREGHGGRQGDGLSHGQIIDIEIDGDRLRDRRGRGGGGRRRWGSAAIIAAEGRDAKKRRQRGNGYAAGEPAQQGDIPAVVEFTRSAHDAVLRLPLSPLQIFTGTLGADPRPSSEGIEFRTSHLQNSWGCGSAQSSDSQGEHPIVLDFDCVFWS